MRYNLPTVLKSKNLGRLVRRSPGKVNQLSAASRLYISVLSRNQAAIRPPRGASRRKQPAAGGA